MPRFLRQPRQYIGKDLPLAADARSLGERQAIYRQVKGRDPSRLPMPMFLFHAFVGKDIPAMWRRLRANPVSLDTAATYAIHPEAMTSRPACAACSSPSGQPDSQRRQRDLQVRKTVMII